MLDFGIARLRDTTGTVQSTRAGMTMGTPPFLAPEQALGAPNKIDARTDLWAVGATLFRLLTGRLVHDGETPRQVTHKAATEHAASLARVAPEVPASVVKIDIGKKAFIALEDSTVVKRREIHGALILTCRNEKKDPQRHRCDRIQDSYFGRQPGDAGSASHNQPAAHQDDRQVITDGGVEQQHAKMQTGVGQW